MSDFLYPPPLRRTLTAAVVALVTALLTFLAAYEIFIHQPRHIENQQANTARRLLGNVQQIIGTNISHGQLRTAEQVLTLQGTDPDIKVLAAIDHQGKVLLSTRFADKSRPAIEVIAGFDPTQFAQIRERRRLQIEKSVSRDAIVGYAPLVLATQAGQLRPTRVGALYLEYDLARARRNAWRHTLALDNWLGLLLALALSAAILVYLLNRWVSRPLRHLGACVSLLASGKTGVSSRLRGSGEIAQLGQAMDHLSNEIDTSRNALRLANLDLEQQVAERTAHLEREIHVRKEVEKALTTSERRLYSVLETVTDGVALWDVRGRLDYANPSIRKLFGNDNICEGSTELVTCVAKLLDADGAPLPTEDLAINKVLQNKPQSDGIVVQIDNPDTGRRWLNFTTVPMIHDDGRTPVGMVSTVTDITDLKSHAEVLARLAHFDTLTGLPNRRLLHDRMRQLLAHTRRTQKLLVVCYLDLDGFKAVNDEFGHEAGDELLKEAGQRITEQIRVNDTAARLGGDEFVVLLTDVEDKIECEPVLQRVIAALSEPYYIGGTAVSGVSASIGIALYPSDDNDPDTLLRHADHAMYTAKRMGKNKYEWFDAGQEQRLKARHDTLTELRDGLARGEFVLHYQPKVNCRHGTVVGAEALIRWQHPVLGLLPPIHFLPLVEDNDLALEIGEFVITEALRESSAWRRDGLALEISVNVFARQLQQQDFVAKLATQIERITTIDQANLDLEIVENAALEGISDIAQLVQDCRAIGVTFALDDFGTGYSTLNHLRRIPTQSLKIDRSFVRDMLNDPDDRTLVFAIIGLGHSFNREIIAEGVEEIEQIQILLNAGCEVMQGYYFAKPMASNDFVAWVGDFRPDPAWHYLQQPAMTYGDATTSYV